MKFEKFIKRIGTHGMLLTDGATKWICDGNVAMIVPNGVNVAYSVTAEMPDVVSDVLDCTDVPTNGGGAALIHAELAPDAKAKDIWRVYSNNVDEIAIISADWSLIENTDTTEIGVDADGKVIALIVYSGYDDAREPVGIIFNDGFNIYEEIKKENV